MFSCLVLNKKSGLSTHSFNTKQSSAELLPAKPVRQLLKSSLSNKIPVQQFSSSTCIINVSENPKKGGINGPVSESVDNKSGIIKPSKVSPKEERKQNNLKLTVEKSVQEWQASPSNEMIEAKKPLIAPPNPPPPVPAYPKGITVSSTRNGSPLTPRPNGETILGRKDFNQQSSLNRSNGSLGSVPAKGTIPRVVQLTGHVGFDSLPHQVVKKCTEQGFQFNIMCVGETGMGKSTLIESLFNMKLEFPPCNNELKTVELRSKTYDVAEGGIRLKLTIVETAGFGDQLDKEKSAAVIVGYINEQFENYLKEELKVKRCLDYYNDTRIHACLYFISPTGHGLKALDVVTLRLLSERVNVIPVIAKADTTSKDELIRFKAKILSELRGHNIPIYQFPTDDETVRAVNEQLNKLIPYAVVGSTDFVKKENGKTVRARKYPWGIVEVENEDHCDFVKLREAVLRTNVDALRERTHCYLYEAYRRERLRAMNVGDGDTGPKLMEAFASKRQQFDEEMVQKEKQMREEYSARFTRKEEELKRKEEMLNIQFKDTDEKYFEEISRLESQIKNLTEERNKIEAKSQKRNKK